MEVYRFLASGVGRVVRIVVGMALIAVGAGIVGGSIGWILALVGLIPMVAGLFDFCVFAPLAGLPLDGDRLRQRLADSA
jgi:hypothetical protein